MDGSPKLLFMEMAIEIYSPESIAVEDVHRWSVMFIYCPLQCISVDLHHHLSCSTKSIDSFSSVSIAEAMGYYFVYCPECVKNIRLKALVIVQHPQMLLKHSRLTFASVQKQMLENRIVACGL